MSANRPFFFQYDIPEVALIDTNSGLRRMDRFGRLVTRPVIDNPSDDLWRAGCIRITKSCWVVMESDLNRGAMLGIIRIMNENGVKNYSVPFDNSGMCTLREMAIANIRTEIEERLADARATRDAAFERLENESDANFVARRRRFMSAARAIERRIKRSLDLVAGAAARFGINSTDIGVEIAAADCEIIADVMARRAATFATAHGILTRRGGMSRTVAEQLSTGEMPAAIVADWLCDADETEAGDALRDAFSGGTF